MPGLEWLDRPIPEDPPPRGRNTGAARMLPRLTRLIGAPGVWHKVAVGGQAARSANAINSGALPGRWEAITRQNSLYVRFLGFDE